MFSSISISEKGESFADLTLQQAMELQALRFCRVTPTPVSGRWRITDVAKVGVAVIDGCELRVVPKTSLENIVFMATMGGVQLHLPATETRYGAETSIPIAIARAFLGALDHATRRGLLKGYRSVQEASTVVRGRWDIPRQLAARPGIPLPVEIDFDDFTEDIVENRILQTALRVLSRLAGVSAGLHHLIKGFQVLFADVESLPRGVPLPETGLNRLSQHYAVPLRLARVILEAVSWTHHEGATVGGTFLVNMAQVFEGYVANRLRAILAEQGLAVTAQDHRWWLDADRVVALRPDIVISADGVPLTVADTKYKVLGAGHGSPPNGDVYQAVAYALALNVPDAHLLYVSGDVIARRLEVPTAGVRVHVHAIPISGTIEEVEAGVAHLARALVPHATPA
jgi:5-methylcytosine-specific restriction enzyme subunit McrC